MRRITLDLASSDMKLVLEGLESLEKQWAHVCENSDDEISDYGNDLIELRLLIKSLRNDAISVFGDNVVNFSRDLL
ncbi:hypothetical protein AL539_13180 [Vibrio alginolyticus]|uniref:Uncharacterized protein n=1 Tax=Vibrio alginolyticus TaxID=663 RepID=A0A7Y4EZF1_VIBAL|nr:hypothetical protein AL541_16305 [Vibrio alginolyticus]AVF74685.1 hypothetical protein AL539_13180 [Vibrio alginolyticus]NOI10526.1 hypothetical protein [Vibrio alginolyticus]TKF11050.1 hypothetical protein FCV48_04060 [Vibrio alginolyticus]SUP19331.1 Uncharacterised protein [Vibrio alginolyticus]